MTTDNEGAASMAQGPEPRPEDELDGRLLLDILARMPLDLDGLRRELAKQSVFTDTERLRLALQWRENVEEFPDGVWAHVPTLADDVVLTHRVTEEELEIGVLDGENDLDLWARLADEGFPFAAGGELRARYSMQSGPLPPGTSTGICGPEGWLADLAPDQLVGLRLRAGVLHLEEVELTDAEAAKQTLQWLLTMAAAAAQEALRFYQEEDDPIPGAALNEVVLAVRRSHPDAFRLALLPLPEMIEASGLEVWRGFVGVPAAPWHGEPPGLDDVSMAGLRAWSTMLALHRVSGDLPGPDELSAVAGALTRNDDALEAAGRRLADEPDREPVAAAMTETVEGAVRAIPLYLRSCAAQGRGDAVAAESLLDAAVEAGTPSSPLLVELAELRSLRGDAHAARRLYERAGVEPAYPDYAVLRKFLAAPEGEVGRNRPCPCGSGRKYKMCHARQLLHPLPKRASWLWTKAVTFVLRAPDVEVVQGYADILAGERNVPLRRALMEGMAQDLALFDGGLLARFLDHRGSLLPADERALAQSWLDTSRRLLEIVEVRPLRGVRCRDLLTAEEVEVLDRTMPAQAEPLDLVYCRPLPDGAGGLRVQESTWMVPRMMRAQLLGLLRRGATSEEVAAFFAPRSRLPELRTSEGEELVFCTARYDVDDLDAVWGRLAEGLEDTGDDRLTEMVEVHGSGRVLRGTVGRDDRGRLVVEANSVERLRRLQDRVLAVSPTATLVDEATVPAEKMFAEKAAEAEEAEALGLSDPGHAADAPESGLTPEQERELMAEMMRKHEETWPDIELPALSGRTPRQAAADPELRPELEALLDDFDWQVRRQGGGVGLDVDRLRQTLRVPRKT